MCYVIHKVLWENVIKDILNKKTSQVLLRDRAQKGAWALEIFFPLTGVLLNAGRDAVEVDSLTLQKNNSFPLLLTDPRRMMVLIVNVIFKIHCYIETSILKVFVLQTILLSSLIKFDI